MPEAKPMGTLFTEVDLDLTKVELGMQRLHQHMVAGATKSEEAFKIVGIASSRMFEAQRVLATSAYNAIQNKASSTSNDLIRAHEVHSARMAAITKQQFGNSVDGIVTSYNKYGASLDLVNKYQDKAALAANNHNQSLASMTRTLLRLYAAYYVVSSGVQAFTGFIEKGIEAVDKYNLSTTKMGAMMTGFMPADGRDLGDRYKEAYQYAGQLNLMMEDVDKNTLLNFTQLQSITEEMMKQRIIVDTTSQAQIDAYTNIANAVATIAAGAPNMEIQLKQEVRALLQGQLRDTDQLAKMLDAQTGNLKEQVELHKQSGDLLVWLGDQLKGFAAAQKDINATWEATKTTLETTVNRILRDGFQTVYADIIRQTKKLSDWAIEHKSEIAAVIKEGWEKLSFVANTFFEIIKAGYWVWDNLKGAIVTVGIITGTYFAAASFAAVSYAAKITGITAAITKLNTVMFSMAGLVAGIAGGAAYLLASGFSDYLGKRGDRLLQEAYDAAGTTPTTATRAPVKLGSSILSEEQKKSIREVAKETEAYRFKIQELNPELNTQAKELDKLTQEYILLAQKIIQTAKEQNTLKDTFKQLIIIEAEYAKGLDYVRQKQIRDIQGEQFGKDSIQYYQLTAEYDSRMNESKARHYQELLIKHAQYAQGLSDLDMQIVMDENGSLITSTENNKKALAILMDAHTKAADYLVELEKRKQDKIAAMQMEGYQILYNATGNEIYLYKMKAFYDELVSRDRDKWEKLGFNQAEVQTIIEDAQQKNYDKLSKMQDDYNLRMLNAQQRAGDQQIQIAEQTAEQVAAAAGRSWYSEGGITKWVGGISNSGAPNIGEYTGLPVGIINTAGADIINAINNTYAQQAAARQAEEERERQEQVRLWEDSVRAQEQYQAEQQRLWEQQITAQKRFVESLRGQNQTIADWLNEMTRGSLAPVQWAGSWTDEYARQKALAYTPARAGATPEETAALETAKARDVSAYLSYAKEYLEFQKSYGNAGSYQTAYAQVTKDISYLGDIKNIEDMLGSMGLGKVETDLRKVIKAFVDVGTSTQDLKEFMLAYNAVLIGNDGAVVQTKDVGLYMGYAALAAGKTKEALDTYISATQTAAGDTATGAMIGALEDYRLKTIDTVGDNTIGTKGLIAGLDAYITKAGEAGSSDETKGTGALFKSLRDYIDKAGAAAGDAGTAGLTSAIGTYIRAVTDPNGAVDAITGKAGLNAAIDAYVRKTGSFVGKDNQEGTSSLMKAINDYVNFTKKFVGNPELGTGALLDSMGKYVVKTGEVKSAAGTAEAALKLQKDATGASGVAGAAGTATEKLKDQSTATGYSGVAGAAGTAAAILTEQTKATGITSGVAGAAQVAKTELEKQKDATGASGIAGAAGAATTKAGDLITNLGGTLTPFENVIQALKNLTGETGFGGVEKYFEALATKLGTPFTASAGTAAAAAIIGSYQAPYAKSEPYISGYTEAKLIGIINHPPDPYAHSGSKWYTGWTEYEYSTSQPIWSGGKAKGGKTSGLSLAGEIGPEWVAPTYEPERSNFLKDTGVAQTLKEILVQSGGGGGDGRPIIVNLVVDGKVLGNVMAKQARTNPEYIDSIRRLN